MVAVRAPMGDMELHFLAGEAAVASSPRWAITFSGIYITLRGDTESATEREKPVSPVSTLWLKGQ
ncbi:hypothetical protein Ssi02_07210 [Sinosporangium siamense]|uniref:Uncharacterized protein n=1 Tax=Sinosporangium siamense TaxID=1367973 RepID=A0A919RAQ4_9ACTN|nr:hypothetical protein Ssi02_07210 [Sinosporangium siamense]